MEHTGIAVIESKLWRNSNVSVRGLFDLIADLAVETPHGYHYEMANSEVSLKEAIPRIASYRNCRYLCLAMHGDEKGLQLLNDERLTRTELRNLMGRVDAKAGAKLHGVHMASCLFGAPEIAEHVLLNSKGLVWLSGYREEIDWISSSAMDLLFFNRLLTTDSNTELQRVGAVAEYLREAVPGLIQELGFGVYVRRAGGGGVTDLLAT